MQDEPVSRTFLESALSERLRGFEVVERDIEIASTHGALHAELAGVDALGRLWIVIATDGEGERALIDALEWSSFASERGVELARAWEVVGVRDGAPPIHVAIVALRGDATLARRAAAAGIALFELERWTGASGERLQLVSRTGDGHELDARPDVFLRGLPDATRSLAERAITRVTRIDGELEVVAGRARLAWLAQGRELASLAAHDGALAGRVGARGAERDLARDEDVERWLAEALTERLDAGLDDRLDSRTEPTRARASQRALDPEEPILSAEELAAFRD